MFCTSSLLRKHVIKEKHKGKERHFPVANINCHPDSNVIYILNKYISFKYTAL